MAVAAATLVAQQAEAVPDWQKAAGGTASFNEASVRLTKPGKFHPPSFEDWSSDDFAQDPKGKFFADFPLAIYVAFAYKLHLSGDQRRLMVEGLPDWVKDNHYTIEAKAPLHATKDQYRLMVQQLLAERFGLKLHFEDKEMRVLAMVLVTPGKTGPRLIPHADGPACDAKPGPDVFPPVCYRDEGALLKNGQWMHGSRAISMLGIGRFLASLGVSKEDIGRSVVDQTGLQGLWDFTLLTDVSTGPALLEAMPEQLGIKMEPGKATLSVPVIDHVQEPSVN
jgi:uncharacterized protein (TIGR03435 family)